MAFDPAELDTLSRDELILRARARGVERPEQMTRVELRDEIVRLSEPDLERQRRSRGWLGVARDLLASVVESGLNLPDAAAAIRGDGQGLHPFQGPPPVATVTLSEIYAAQGHYEQALRMLDEVIEREPEHATARAIRDRIAEERDLGPGRRRKVAETKGDPILTPQPPAVAPVAAPEPAAPVPEPVAVAAEFPMPAAGPASVAPEPPASVAVEPPASVAAEPAFVAEPPAFVAEPPAFVAAEPALVSPEPPAFVAEPPALVTPEPPFVTPEPPAFVTPEPVVTPEAVLTHEAVRPEPAQAPVSTVPSPAVLVLQTENRAFLYWRLPAVSDSLRLRGVTVRPSLEGPEVEEQDHRLTLAVGGFWLSRHAAGTEVRAAIGELSTNGFSPLAVARVLGTSDPEFEPPGVEADHELEVAARSAAGL